jgi:TRAP-type uncharacterized transport system fused permease subunit
VRTNIEILMMVLGIATVLEITRRVLGIALVIFSGVFMAYAFLGPYAPALISHRGVSLNRFADHMWLTTEGVLACPSGSPTTSFSCSSSISACWRTPRHRLRSMPSPVRQSPAPTR